MKFLLVAAALSLAWCDPAPPTPIGPEPLPPAQLTCKTACARLRWLGCKEAAPTPEGASCEMVCENADASPVPEPVACISRAESCPAAGKCE